MPTLTFYVPKDLMEKYNATLKGKRGTSRAMQRALKREIARVQKQKREQE